MWALFDKKIDFNALSKQPSFHFMQSVVFLRRIILIIGDLRPKLHPCFYDILINFMEKEPCTKFFSVLISFPIVRNLQSFEFGEAIPTYAWKMFRPWFSLYIFVNFMKKEPSTKIYGVFDHFSRVFEIKKFWIIKLCLGVRDVIHANEDT